MKLVKSLLLGSVAGLAAVAGAQAADLPAKKAAAVEYVRVCSTYGAGFFYIPGTDTCLRVGGRVRAEYRYFEPDDRTDDTIGFRARGRIQLDARTATAYGLLRTFVRFEITRDTGVYNSAPGAITQTPNVDQAFIQFGGLTAGRALTFFDNGDIDGQYFGTVRWSDQPNVNLLAYTFSFGNGFSATLSLEEGRFASRTGLEVGDELAGQRMPDVVANVKYAGTWGSVQLSGALHQLRGLPFVLAATPGVVYEADTDYGYAISAQANFNLPMLGASDAFWIAGTWTDGAPAYAGFGGAVEATYDIDGTDADIDNARAWSVAAGLRHYWTPELRQNVFGSYGRIDYSDVFGLADLREWRVGTNVLWSPVSNLTLGAEVLYANTDLSGVDEDDNDRWEARLRVQRDF
ncbi:porin [Microvirga guangxiensis]|uniref:Porin n=1 Tax=Microvirga guangxiensis TaxID=549386 RepID=A0A1G5BH46_9HYPH|nr:porin [Microvirga guangxiensis]SCX89457.1 Phosphate-selective porin [Microvirga guangxiensis]